jgi:hypothetical protein
MFCALNGSPVGVVALCFHLWFLRRGFVGHQLGGGHKALIEIGPAWTFWKQGCMGKTTRQLRGAETRIAQSSRLT